MRAVVRSRLAVLGNDQFRRLLAGRTVSFLGDGFFAVASMWLVYELTGSTAYTGLAGFLSRAPSVLKVLAGPVVDRAQLDRVLVGSEVAGVAFALVVPVAAALGHLHVVVVLATIPLMALSEVFAAPAQNAVLPRLVPDDSLVRTNSAYSVATRAVDAISQAVGGALVAAVGAVALFAVDAATYAVGALAFASLTVPSQSRDDGPLDPAAYAADLREGFDLLAGSVAGRLLVGSLLVNLLTGVAFAVLPAFADAIGGPATYGLLLSGLAVGSVVGSVVASALDALPLGRTVVAGFAATAVCWTGGVLAATPAVAVVLLAASRVPVGVYNVSAMATLQTGVPDDLLGRVTATASSAANATLAAGLLVGGFVGDAVGVRATMLASGAGAAAMVGYWLSIPSLRRFGPPTEVAAGSFE